MATAKPRVTANPIESIEQQLAILAADVFEARRPPAAATRLIRSNLQGPWPGLAPSTRSAQALAQRLPNLRVDNREGLACQGGPDRWARRATGHLLAKRPQWLLGRERDAPTSDGLDRAHRLFRLLPSAAQRIIRATTTQLLILEVSKGRDVVQGFLSLSGIARELKRPPKSLVAAVEQAIDTLGTDLRAQVNDIRLRHRNKIPLEGERVPDRDCPLAMPPGWRGRT